MNLSGRCSFRVAEPDGGVLDRRVVVAAHTEIGHILGVSSRTVQKHLQHIYEKLGVETRVAAAALVLGGRSDG